jgi:hypothetical protein
MICVSARSVALLGLRRPEQREQLQWPVRLHLCGGGCDQSARWRRIRRACGKLGAGIGAPAPADAGLMPCRVAPPLLPWWPFWNRPLMLGAQQGARWLELKFHANPPAVCSPALQLSPLMRAWTPASTSLNILQLLHCSHNKQNNCSKLCPMDVAVTSVRRSDRMHRFADSDEACPSRLSICPLFGYAGHS